MAEKTATIMFTEAELVVLAHGLQRLILHPASAPPIKKKAELLWRRIDSAMLDLQNAPFE